MNIYVGRITASKMEVFRSKRNPTRASHGHRFLSVMGPFRTIRAANFMRDCGFMNPHCTDVAAVEKIAKKAWMPKS